MALDKLVDSAQLDSDLASVANAIRTKGGTSAPLTFPQGFVDAVGAIETGGGGMPENDFISVNMETVTVGENSVTNSKEYQDYLMGLVSAGGTFLAMSIHKKQSYTYNEWCLGYNRSNTQSMGYRYRGGWQPSLWFNLAYDAVAPVGTVVDVYTVKEIF